MKKIKAILVAIIISTSVSAQIDSICRNPQRAAYAKYDVSKYLKSKIHNCNSDIVIKFVVTSIGSIEQVTVVDGSDNKQEAVNAIRNMKQWVPAQNNGKNVSSWFYIPITCKKK